MRSDAVFVVVFIVVMMVIMTTTSENSAERAVFAERCQVAGGQIMTIGEDERCVKSIEYIDIK